VLEGAHIARPRDSTQLKVGVVAEQVFGQIEVFVQVQEEVGSSIGRIPRVPGSGSEPGGEAVAGLGSADTTGYNLDCLA
jgi:hypothetical protein